MDVILAAVSPDRVARVNYSLIGSPHRKVLCGDWVGHESARPW